MKKIKLVLLFLCLGALFSCSSIKTAINTATNSSDLVPKFPALDRPRDIKNSAPEPNVGNEKAVVVSVYSRYDFYIGMEQFPIEQVGEIIKKRFTETPAQKGKIYLNAAQTAEFGDIVRALDIIRKQEVEEVGLLVEPVKREAPFNLLKIKILPEPKAEDTFETDPMFKHPILRLQKNGTVSFAAYDKNFGLKNEKPEIKPDEDDAKIQQLIKDKGAKTISIKAPRSAAYGKVVRLADAAYSAGATTVYILLDDLEE